MVATGAQIQCSVQAPDTFSTNLQSPLLHSDSAAIRRGVELAAESANRTTPLTPRSEMCQCRPADVFTKAVLLVTASLLISIRPYTDATLDRLKLGNENLLKLQTSNIGSSSSQQPMGGSV